MTSQRQTTTDRPWLDSSTVPQIIIEGVSKRYGEVTAVDDVSLAIHKGEMFALVGASGCGKTSLLRMLAGFATPDSGRILIDGVDMTHVPPYERPVNMMFQSYALFPHMTVADNVGYGLKRMKVATPERQKRVLEALEMVQLQDFGSRKPHQLSGGQRQRVALARALIRRPKVLLLDEPLSALDKKLRESTQFELMDLQYEVGITFVVVTHDQDEAMTLASRIAVMNRGTVVQIGAPADLYEHPNSRFVADFFGTANLLEAQVTRIDGTEISVYCRTLDSELRVASLEAPAIGEAVALAVRPEKIRLHATPPAATPKNLIGGQVWELGYLGNRSTYQIKTPTGARITVAVQNDRRTTERAIDWNDQVQLSFDPSDAVLLRA